MLTNWSDLPEELKSPEVIPYYELLKKRRLYLGVKRIIDIVFALILLVALLPLLLILALLIKLDSRGPVFYRQIRVTQDNKDFIIYKFRTMVEGVFGKLVFPRVEIKNSPPPGPDYCILE